MGSRWLGSPTKMPWPSFARPLVWCSWWSLARYGPLLGGLLNVRPRGFVQGLRGKGVVLIGSHTCTFAALNLMCSYGKCVSSWRKSVANHRGIDQLNDLCVLSLLFSVQMSLYLFMQTLLKF